LLIFNISLNSTPNQNITEDGDSQTRMRSARRDFGDVCRQSLYVWFQPVMGFVMTTEAHLGGR
jgi:hypothetical protein